MKVIEEHYEVLTDLSSPLTLLKAIEHAGRTCYKSYDKATEDSCLTFCKMLISRNHEAVLEHSSLSVKFTVDRAIANELVRHRIASYCQESTRYVNYSNERFGNEIKVILPCTLKKDSEPYKVWYNSCLQCESSYMKLLSLGEKPEIARNVLPLSTATEIVCTANIREWRQILSLRTSVFAHPQMRSIMSKLLIYLKKRVPVLFDDITP